MTGEGEQAPLTLAEALSRMADAEDTLRAIGAGEIDAFVLSDGNDGRHIFTLSTADRTYRMFVENMHDGAATLSSSGVVLYANRRLATLLQTPVDALVGSSLGQFIARDSPVAWAQLQSREAFSTGFEANLVDANGTTVPVLIGTAALGMESDRLTCLTFTDLSAQKAQDREIARLVRNEIERMADLQSAQIALIAASERSRDEALTQTQVKSQFLATMSHEIRTPMNGVIGLSSLLIGTDLDATQRRYAAGIHTAGKALLTVINDILDFSKVEAGKLVLDIGDFDVSVVLAEVTALVNPTAQLKGLTMVTRRDPKLPARLRGDGGRVRQILLNLVGNAVKFTARGSVTLRFVRDTTAPAEPGTVVARIEVVDTGMGIAQDDVERLFEPFSQADASITRAFGGTGLGLAICRQLTEAMGGTIGVDSVSGQGSTFWCRIPFEVCPSPPGSGIAVPSDDERLQVLVVGAGLPQTQVLLADLRRWMMMSTATDNGASAIVVLRRAADGGRPFDAVVVETDRDGSGTVDLVHRIVDDPDLRSMHVVVLNQEPPPDDPDAAGNVSYLAEPVQSYDLYDCLSTTAPDPPPGALTGRVAGAVREPSPTGPQRRILLVEDNEINQMVAVGILTTLGYQLDVADDGIEGIAMAAADTYDAILMDCQMPRMDGLSATTEIRRREGDSRHTPIIAMTASALLTDRDACLAAGMDDYLSKPVDPLELAAVLERWISGSAAGGSPAAGLTAAAADLTAAAADLSAAAASLRSATPAGSASPGPDPLTERLDELRGDRTPPELALVDRLIVSFLERAPQYLDTLADAVRTADAAALESRAHSFRGAAGNIGAAGAAEICRHLEDIGRAGHLDSTTDGHVQRLRAEIDAVHAQLTAARNGHEAAR